MNLAPHFARELGVRDQLQIHTLLAQACRALDLSRPADFAAAFTADGLYRMVSPDADGRQERYAHRGTSSLLEFARQAAVKRQGNARHWTGNPVVESDGAGGATAWSYTMLIEIDPATRARTVLLTGIHEDVLVRTEAGWRLASRTVVPDI